MYATRDEMTARFGEREMIEATDRATPRTGIVDAAVADGALQDASDLIDGYVGRRHGLPLPSTPPILGRIACDLARFYLNPINPTDAMIAAYKAALATLALIARGDVSLGLPGADAAQPAGGVLVSAGHGRVFDADTLGDFL